MSPLDSSSTTPAGCATCSRLSTHSPRNHGHPMRSPSGRPGFIASGWDGTASSTRSMTRPGRSRSGTWVGGLDSPDAAYSFSPVPAPRPGHRLSTSAPRSCRRRKAYRRRRFVERFVGRTEVHPGHPGRLETPDRELKRAGDALDQGSDRPPEAGAQVRILPRALPGAPS